MVVSPKDNKPRPALEDGSALPVSGDAVVLGALPDGRRLDAAYPATSKSTQWVLSSRLEYELPSR